MKPKTFKQIKKASKKRAITDAIVNIAIKINDKLTVWVKPGVDADKVREKYTKHTNDYSNYAQSYPSI